MSASPNLAPLVKSNPATRVPLHGGLSETLLVGAEKQSDFDDLLDALLAEHQPDSLQSRCFIEDAALAHWFLFRRQRAYNAIEYAIYTASPDACNWTPEQIRRLSFAERYRTQAERGLKRALGFVDSWKRNQRREADRLTRQSQWEANYAIRERRMTLQEEKFHRTEARQAARAAIRSATNVVPSPVQQKNQPQPPPPTQPQLLAENVATNLSLENRSANVL